MENITEKEFSRLKRRELLELLLSQIQEDERLERRGSIMTAQLTRQDNSLKRLKNRLNEKDDQIEKLKERLNEKDELIEKLKQRLDQKDKQLREMEKTLREERESRRIDLEEAGSIAEAALRLSGIFEAAQDAADRYLENLQVTAERKGSCPEKVIGREVRADGNN